MELLIDQVNKDQKIKELIGKNNDLENYFRNSNIQQLFFDNDLILRKFTPAAMKQFKLDEGDIGRSIYELKNNLRFPSFIKNINWVLATSNILEKEIQTMDLCWYQMNIIPNLKEEDYQPNGVIITFIDITHRVKDLKEQEKIIAEYETLLDTISHDIRNRLTGMLLSVEMLKDSDFEDKEEIKCFSETIENGINKIKIIINELFDSRDQKRKYEAVDELLNIENILEDVKFALINEIFKANATISCEVNTSEIVFPRRHLRSIIYNLVSNALKFRSSDRVPEVIIKTYREDNFLVISVRDNGIGIDPSNLEDIFSKYFRIEDSVEGSGVGLHLVKTLVTRAGGKVAVNSQLGVGTEFKIYLKTSCN